MGDINQLLGLDIRNGILFLAAILVVVVLLLQKTDWIVERFGIKSKRQLEEEKQNSDIKELKAHAEKTDTNIDKLLTAMTNLQELIQGVSDQVKSLQCKNDMNEAARLKDRIKAYSQYSENSFVHTVVEREMPTWKIVDD